jgi:hypothetical protein
VRALDVKRRNRAYSFALLLLAGVVALAAVAPSPASAGRYKVVEVCRQSRAGLTTEEEPIFFEGPLTSQGFRVVDKCDPSADGSITLLAEGVTLLGGKRWTLRAPPDTTIRGVEFDLVPSGPWNVSSLEWSLRADGRTIESAEGQPSPKRAQHNEPTLDASVLTGALLCRGRGGCSIGAAGLDGAMGVKDLTLTLEDEISPEFITPLTGSLLSDELLRDVERVSYWGDDVGSGVAGAFLLVDGVARPLARDPNGGACVEPYRVLVPCRSQVRSSVSLDTRQLSEGFHEVEVVLVDAAGNEKESNPIFVFVHNAPTNLDPPAIIGPPEVGSRLSVSNGTWLGDPSSFSYQWLRCPARAQRVVECAPIIGATGTSFTPQELDRNSRDLVVVTAINASGSETAFTEATQVIGADTTPPVLRNVRLSRKRLRPGKRPTTLRFSSSEAGGLTAAVASPKGKTLTLLKRGIKAGSGKVAIDSLLRGRARRPGSYQLLVFAADNAGNVSRPVRLPFKILAR